MILKQKKIRSKIPNEFQSHLSEVRVSIILVYCACEGLQESRKQVVKKGSTSFITGSQNQKEPKKNL